MIRPGKPVKLNSDVLNRLELIRNQKESYSASISKLLDIAVLVDANLPRLRELR